MVMETKEMIELQRIKETHGWFNSSITCVTEPFFINPHHVVMVTHVDCDAHGDWCEVRTKGCPPRIVQGSAASISQQIHEACKKERPDSDGSETNTSDSSTDMGD